MEHDNDILFTIFEIEKVKRSTSLEAAYRLYQSGYRRIAGNITEVVCRQENADENLEALLYDVFYSHPEGKRSVLKNLVYNYRYFLSKFICFLEDNEPLGKLLKGKGLDINEIENWKDRFTIVSDFRINPDDVTGCLQFMVSSKKVVENLTGIYHFFWKRSDVNVFVAEGCRLLGVTWIDYINAIRLATEGVRIDNIYSALKDILKRKYVQRRKTTTDYDAIERKGAAFAEYPYEFVDGGSVQILPIGKTHGLPNNLYDEKEMKLKLNDAKGMAVALFDHQEGGKTYHCLTYAGTRLLFLHTRKIKVMAANAVTDIFQFLSLPSTVYFAAVGILHDVMKLYPGEDVYVFGHSLGGGLAQYACAAVNSRGAKAYCYNSAGLGEFSLGTITNKHGDIGKLVCRIQHICSQHDPVSLFGTLLQEEKAKFAESGSWPMSHGLGQLNRRMNGRELLVKRG